MHPIEEVRGQRVLIRFDADKCIHSRHCVLARPDVFVPNVEGEWIRPGRATPDEIAALALACPSGAITYERLDGGQSETPPPVNVAFVRENGPIALHAEMTLEGHGTLHRATLCRCGASNNKPFCDKSHVAAKFVATGEPPSQDSPPLVSRTGPLTVTPLPNGPLLLKGNLELCSGTGRTLLRVQQTTLCRCGRSGNKPFCDGSHAKVGFTSD